MKFLDIEMPIWGYGGVALWGGTPATFAMYALKRYGYKDVGENTHADGHTYFEDGAPWMLWLRTLDPPLVAHECLHITFDVLESRGLAPTPAAQEAYTYTQQWLMETILRSKQWRKVRL